MAKTGRVRVTVDPQLLAAFLAMQGKRFVAVSNVALMLGTSTKTAGKILATLEKMGYVRRYSRRVYEVLLTQGRELP